MPVIIHPGKCDQAKECSCPEVCPNEAWYRDPEDRKWLINESKGISCGLCIKACPSGAVLLATTLEEKEKILEHIKNDKEFTPEKLFVERYGGMLIENKTEISIQELDSKIKENIVLIEFFNDDSIHCLINCVPYSDFAPDLEVYKINVDQNKELKDRYSIKELPILIAFSKGREIKRIEGFIGEKKGFQEFLSTLSNIKP